MLVTFTDSTIDEHPAPTDVEYYYIEGQGYVLVHDTVKYSELRSIGMQYKLGIEDPGACNYLLLNVTSLTYSYSLSEKILKPIMRDEDLETKRRDFDKIYQIMHQADDEWDNSDLKSVTSRTSAELHYFERQRCCQLRLSSCSL